MCWQLSARSGRRSRVEARAVDVADRPAFGQHAIPASPQRIDQHRFPGIQHPDGRSGDVATLSNVDPRLGIAPYSPAGGRRFRW